MHLLKLLMRSTVVLSIAVPCKIYGQIRLRVSLSDLADSATQHFPQLKAQQAAIRAAQYGVTATRHSFLPQVRISEQLNTGTDNSLAGSFFTFGLTPSTSAGVRAENNPSIGSGNVGIIYAEYELYNFGLNTARLNQAKSSVDLQQAALERDRYLLRLQVARLYFTILKSQYRLSADQQNIYRYDSIFRVIRALSSAGIKPGADSSLAKAELSKARVNYNQTSGTLQQQKDELSYLTGLPSFTLTLDSASLIPGAHLVVEDTSSTDEDRFPLLRYYASERRNFLAERQVIRKTFLPKVSLVASTWARGSSIAYSDQYKNLMTGWGYQRFNYLAGIAVSYNLFNGLFKKDQLSINQAKLDASGFSLEQQKQDVVLSARQAEDAVQTTGDNYREIPIQLQAASETYQQKLAQYRAGLISLIDLNNASFVLYRSQIDFTEGLTDLFLARLEKSAFTGTLNNFIQTFK